MKKTIGSYSLIAMGSVLFAVAFDWFFVPNQVAMGGVTGLAQVIHALFPSLSVGALSIALNIPLFLAGWWFLGWHLLVSSAFAMAVSSLTIDAIAAAHSFAPMDPMLASICGGALLGLGLGIVFAQGATTGGTDVVARLLKLKLPWLPIGNLVLAADSSVLLLAALVFGRVEAALYGVIALVISTWVMDTVLYGLDTSKVAYIISDSWESIRDTLMREQERGITILHGAGGYTGNEKHVLMMAFKQREIVDIRKRVHAIDPEAFMIVCNAHEVLGFGFGDYQKEDI